MNFYSQQEEDKILFNKYLNYRDGFFIELGGMDGITYSNTLFFETFLNWTGVLIEPTFSQFEKLKENRKNTYNFNYAISQVEGLVEFIGDGALGGLTKTMSDLHRKGWNLDDTFSPFSVNGIPISKLLIDLKIERVDLFSIDVEGGELEVLKTYDWTIPTYLILIEGDYTSSEDEKKKWMKIPNSNGLVADQNFIDRNNECKEILLSNEFEFIEKIGCNEVWINKKNKK
jgi:FkbM family methyltransferase